MVQKKRMLDERLRRKQEQRIKTEMLQAESGGNDNMRVAISRQEELMAQEEINKLQEVNKYVN